MRRIDYVIRALAVRAPASQQQQRAPNPALPHPPSDMSCSHWRRTRTDPHPHGTQSDTRKVWTHSLMSLPYNIRCAADSGLGAV